jgi:hypothetical protein
VVQACKDILFDCKYYLWVVWLASSFVVSPTPYYCIYYFIFSSIDHQDTTPPPTSYTTEEEEEGNPISLLFIYYIAIL